MSQKTMKISGWVLSVLLSLLFVFSAFLKLTADETAQTATVGLDAGTYRLIGVIEMLSVLLFLIPRTGLAGALLLIAYMGGAIATHLLLQQPVGVAVTVQVLLWIAVALRFPELRQQIWQKKTSPASQLKA